MYVGTLSSTGHSVHVMGNFKPHSVPKYWFPLPTLQNNKQVKPANLNNNNVDHSNRVGATATNTVV